MNNMKQKTQKGFTLIELLVVIAIIGLLASVVLLALNSARQKSRDAKRVADARQIATALELYFNDCGGYPVQSVTLGGATRYNLATGNTGVCASGDDASAATEGGFRSGAVVSGSTPFMSQSPQAPTPIDNTGTCNAGNHDYVYTSAAANTFTLSFCLGAQTGGLPIGARTIGPAGTT